LRDVQEDRVSKFKSTMSAVLLLVISSALTLFGLEVAFRVLGVKPFPEVEKEHLPYEKNSKGLRDHEYAYEKEEGVFRIVATGDSFTYGTGVPSMDDIFLKRLEKMLNADVESGHRYEVINGAEPGYNTPEEYEWLRKEGVKYSPDVIVVIYFFNDATFMGTVTSLFRPIHEQAAEQSRGRSVFYNYVKYRIMRSVISRKTTEEYRQAYFEGKGGIKEAGLWGRCKESMLGIKALAEANDARLLFVLFPILTDLDEDYAFQDIHDIVMDYLVDSGIEAHSLLPAFVEHDGTAESLWVNIINAHPNEKGHEIAAQSLYSYLMNSDLVTE
jgi:hypothetical protein